MNMQHANDVVQVCQHGPEEHDLIRICSKSNVLQEQVTVRNLKLLWFKNFKARHGVQLEVRKDRMETQKPTNWVLRSRKGEKSKMQFALVRRLLSRHNMEKEKRQQYTRQFSFIRANCVVNAMLIMLLCVGSLL